MPDAGRGTGPISSTTGTEMSRVSISLRNFAAARELHLHLRFDRGSFHDLPYEGASFGGILAWYSLIHTHPDDVPAVLAEFTRVLTPGGSLFLGYFDGPPREQFAHAVASAYFWSAGALSELLADAGLTVISHERRDRTPAEVSRRPHGALTARRL